MNHPPNFSRISPFFQSFRYKINQDKLNLIKLLIFLGEETVDVGSKDVLRGRPETPSGLSSTKNHPASASSNQLRQAQSREDLRNKRKQVNRLSCKFLQMIWTITYRVTRRVVSGRSKYCLLRPETTLLVTLY